MQHVVDGRRGRQIAGQLRQTLAKSSFVFDDFAQQACFKRRADRLSQQLHGFELDAVQAGAVQSRSGQQQHDACFKAMDWRQADFGWVLLERRIRPRARPAPGHRRPARAATA